MPDIHLKKLLKSFLIILLSGIYLSSFAQKVTEPTDTPADWSKPYPPFRIAGNLYYVGTYDIGCYLITTSKGNILINTGLANSEKIIENNIKELGLKLADTKILLTTQAHFDHMGAMAALKDKTGAEVMVNENDAQVMKDGGASDYALGKGFSTYKPVSPDKILRNNELITLGTTSITVLNHPGHTKGSCSYLFNVKDDQKTYKILIANMPTIVTEKKFAEVVDYPTIEKDYNYTLKNMRALKFDIWLSSHASQFKLHQKHQPNSAYNPAAFIDRTGYDKELDELQKAYDKKVQKR